MYWPAVLHGWNRAEAIGKQNAPPPSTGKIAVKVINHYGDEVLKVYNVSNTAHSVPPQWLAPADASVQEE